MIIKCYIDESYSNNKNVLNAPTFCGFIDESQQWVKFNGRWKRVLNRYAADYFHFREFADKNHRNFEKTIYDGWTEDKRGSFLYDLALVTSESAVPCGGAANAKRLRETGSDMNPFAKGITMFFEDFLIKLNRVWPDYKGQVLFVYDYCADARNTAPLFAIRDLFSQTDPRFSEIIFGDDKKPEFIPLQAADLHAYSLRQQAERAWETGSYKRPPRRLLDYILSKNMAAPADRLSNIDWHRLIKAMIADEKLQKRTWEKEGDAKKYFPDEHFPYEKYGFVTRQQNLT